MHNVHAPIIIVSTAFVIEALGLSKWKVGAWLIKELFGKHFSMYVAACHSLNSQQKSYKELKHKMNISSKSL